MHFKNWLLHRVTIRSSDQFWGVMVDRRFGIQRSVREFRLQAQQLCGAMW